MSEVSRKIPMRYVYTILAIVAVSVVSLLFYAISERVGNTERYVSLFSGKYFTEQELIQVEMAFASAKLTDYQILDGIVQVPKRQKNAFILALKKTELFVDENEKSSAGSRFWTSESDREAGAISAKQDALAAQIRTFNGIENARVLLDVSETKTGFTREKHVTAAISIRSRIGYQVQKADILSILRLVTGAVCNLSPADVSIVDTRTNQSWRFDAPEIEGGNEMPQEVAEYQKITIQTEPLPQPEIFDCAARDMLMPRTFAEAETETESDFTPGRLKIGNIRILPERRAVALEIKNNQNGENVSINHGILLTSATNATSSSETSPKILPEMVIEPTRPEEQDLSATLTLDGESLGMTLPPMLSLFFGMVAALVIFLCFFVFYLTRKGLFVTAPKAMISENTETERTEEFKAEFNVKPENVETDFRNELLAEIIAETEAFIQEPKAKSTDIPANSNDEKLTENSEERLNTILKTLENIKSEEETAENVAPERERIPEVEALLSVSPQQLALAFMEERAQTAAMLLTEFPYGRQQEILAFIPTKSRLEIESRLTNCSSPDADILRDVALAIQQHLADFNLKTTESETRKPISLEPMPVMSPIRPLADVLPRENSLELVAKTENKAKIETDAEPLVYRFEDMKRLSDEDLRSFLMVCPQSDALLAFLGAESAFVERVLRILPKAEAAQVRYQLKHPGRIRLMEVEYARQRILRLAQNLAKQGKLPSLEMVEA